MDAKGLKKVRDTRAQRIMLLADKWQVRASRALGKRRRGSRPIGVAMEKPQVEMKGEEDARVLEEGTKGCRN